MRQKHKRLLKFVALQERRAMVEAAKCAQIESQIDDASKKITALGGLLDAPDIASASFVGLVLDRLRVETHRRKETEDELARQRDVAMELKRQIKRVEKLAGQVEQRIRDADTQKEKQTILEQAARAANVSVE